MEKLNHWKYCTPFLPNKVFLLTLCWLFCSFIHGQQLTVSDSESGLPVPDVHLYSLDEKRSSVTDKNGMVALDVFHKTDTIIFSHTSYQPIVLPYLEIKKMEFKISIRRATVEMGEFIVSANREKESTRKVVQRIDKISQKEIAFSQPQTAADVLKEKGSVLIQKSQMGGGSPIIRGFEANKVLLVIDGIRMNNAIYRSGHLQNAITIDPAALERVEVVFGPGSIIYGSDALGGVVHYYTKQPKFGSDTINFTEANFYARYGSAANASSQHFDFSYGTKKLALFSSFSRNQFGDLKMGNNRTHGYEDYGKIFQYVQTTNTEDQLLDNPNPNTHINSGYTQYDFLQKVTLKVNDDLELEANFQYSTSTNINRYDRLTELSDNDTLKFAEWYYGPQQRLLAAMNAKIKGKKWFDLNTTTLAFQRIDEDRYQRNFGNLDRTIRKEDVMVYSFNSDFSKLTKDSLKVFYGVEFTHNDVQSNANDYNILTGETANSQSRYPDGGSGMSTFAGYVNIKKSINKKNILNVGARYSHAILKSRFIEQAFVPLPYDEISFGKGALTGSLGWIFLPSEKWQINSSIASGFRNPNVDDYGKVFEKNGFVVVPNNELKPEYVYTGEIGVTRFLAKQKIKITGNGFYTMLQNAIVRRDFQLNGEDSLLIDGTMAKVQANVNSAEGIIYGYSVAMAAKISPSISLSGSVNYTYGWDTTDDMPLAHIPPFYGRAEITHSVEKWKQQFYVEYNAWKRTDELSPGTTDNPDEATADGFPAWHTLNYKLHYTLNRHFSFQGGVENILDTHYKPFASGISGPGRNFMVTVRGRF